MAPQQDRPNAPFRNRDGSPRVVTSFADSGVVEYRPGELIVHLDRLEGGRDDPDGALEVLKRLAGVAAEYDESDLRRGARTGFLRVRFRGDDVDALAVSRMVNRALRARVAGVNTVFKVGAITAAPMHLSPMHLSPMHLSPMHLSTEYGGDPARFLNSSTARPALVDEAALPRVRTPIGAGSATVAIIDTGFPIKGQPEAHDIDFKDLGPGVRERPDLNADEYLDIAAGHSTFIRTIVQRASPTARLFVEGVMENDGDGDEVDVADALARIDAAVNDKRQLLVNLSFGGFYPGDVEPPLVAQAIRGLVDQGAVVVAAAGNEGVCRKKFPAAMPEVIAIGALGSCGPAPFSNHGGWVDASAPGEDLISEFFTYDGGFEPVPASTADDCDDFSGWAMWSGTSFATPAVVGALAELIEIHDCSALDAVDTLLRRPGLFRVPDYGVVVNRIF